VFVNKCWLKVTGNWQGDAPLSLRFVMVVVESYVSEFGFL